MTPSLSGRYTLISAGVRPIISFAASPTARILLSDKEIATTEGSLNTTPLPRKYTKELQVPRSIAILLLNISTNFQFTIFNFQLVGFKIFTIGSRDLSALAENPDLGKF